MSNVFLHGLESTFAWMLEASWQGTLLVALVLLLQWALRGKLNPRWHHALWLLVVARLVLPVLPESKLSLFQFTPSAPPIVGQTITEPIFTASPGSPIVTMAIVPATQPLQFPFSAFTVLALVWLAGTLGLLVLTWQVNRRFFRHVSSSPAVADPRLLQLAGTAARELGIRHTLRIIESEQVQSPAIMGLFCPMLILPMEVRSRFTDEELRFIFLHEFAHLKRGDLFLHWLIALLQIVHWFNPVLWYAFRHMRIDCEPATDALVLSRTGEEQKESYGHVLVKLLQHYRARHKLPTLVSILEDKDQFKRRFTLIMKFTRGAYGWSLPGVAMLALLAAICLTKAKAQDAAGKAHKYFELIFVAEKPGTNDGLGASGPVWAEDFAKLLKNSKCKITVLADAPVQDGPISLRAQTPAGFDVAVTGNWNTSTRAPQKIGYHFHQQPHLTAIGTVVEQSWESSDVLSEGSPLLLLVLTMVDDHDHVLIHIVDHPTAVTSAINSGIQSSNSSTDAEAGRTGDTLAQLVLALTGKSKTIPHDHQRLQILEGFYGADGSWRDVTGILQKSVQNDSLKVSWQQPFTEIGGDPAYLQVKTLIVSYRLDGVEKLATFREENPPVGLKATLP